MLRQLINFIPCLVLGTITAIGIWQHAHGVLILLGGIATFLSGCAAMSEDK